MQRIAFGVVLGIALPVLAGPWPVQQVTNNTTYDSCPSVSGDTVVWRGWGGSSDDIFRAAGLTTNISATPALSESNPSIAGDVLVWEDIQYIYIRDGSGTRQIGNSNSPTQRAYPHTDGKSVVWAGWDGGLDREIFLYDIASETTTQLTVNGDEDRYPRVDGGRVAWEQSAAQNFTGIVPRVMLYDGAVRQITPEAENWSLHMSRDPDISGNRIVYGERVGTWDTVNQILHVDETIFVHDILTDTRFTVGVDDEWAHWPRISGDLVVWSSYMTPNQPDLYGVHLDSGDIMRITDNDYDERHVEVDGHTIVWRGFDGIDYEIYSAVMPEPTTALLLLFGLALVPLRRR